MAIRARADNLSLDYPEQAGSGASLLDFADVWAHREVLRQACVRLTGDLARAEDLVQDTFVTALKSGDTLDRRTSIGPWLATVARRRSIDEIRGRQRVSVMAAPPEPAPGYTDDPADHVLNQELVAQLRAAVDTLTTRERQLLLRQATYGMSLAELAAEEQTSVASVRSVLARARHKLRATLERNGALGVLPAPRLLVSLRDKFTRWAVQFESSLPALTGAGAHVANVFVAVVAALATLLSGAAPPVAEDSVAMIGYSEAAATYQDEGKASTVGRTVGELPTTQAGAPPSTPTPTTTTPTVPNVVPVPPLPTLPQDSNGSTSDAAFEMLSASEDGRYVFASGLNNSGYATVFRSSDFGQTWTRLDANGLLFPARILIPPTYPTKPTLFAIDSYALYQSNNDGTHFVAVAPGRNGAAFSPNYSAGDERLFIAGSPVLEYSVKSGLTNPLAATVGKSMADVLTGSAFTTDGMLILGGTVINAAGTRRGAVYRCTPDACSAPVVLAALRNPPTLRRLANGRIAAWTYDAVYLSTDDGLSFQALASPVVGGVHRAISDGPSDTLLLAMTRHNTTTGLFTSSDDGATWVAVGIGAPVQNGVADVLMLATGAIVAAPMRVVGVTCSTDGASTWGPHC